MPRSSNLRHSVCEALERIGMRPGLNVLVALSGGPDSVALLHVLLELQPRLGYRLCAAHLNHGLRGTESDRDESFCRDLCTRLGVDFKAARTATLDPSMANLEEEARKQRYEFLNQTAQQSSADYIALAHHADDQAETVMMRMLRGAGVSGISAMAECGPGRLIRPMLTLSRQEIAEYLTAIRADFVIDSSNASATRLRNRVRHELLPLLEHEYVPGVSKRLCGLADEMAALDAFVSRVARTEFATIRDHDGSLDLTRFHEIEPAVQI